MSKIDTFDIAPEDEDKFFKYLKWGNRFVNTRIISKERPMSRGQKEAHAEISNLGLLTALWEGLTQDERDAWASAGFYSGQSGYNLFIQDTSYRLSNNIAGVAVANDYHQYKVAKITIPAGGGYHAFYQFHDDNYNIARKITGTQNSYEPVNIAEAMEFAMSWALNYKANLSPFGASPYARMWVQIQYDDGAGIVVYNKTKDLLLSTDWAYITDAAVGGPHTVVRYYLILEFNNVGGEFFFDVPELDYASQNWTIDANCDFIGDSIPYLGVSIVPSWVNWYPALGSTIRSIYPS